MNSKTHDHEILTCYLLESGDIAELDAEQQEELQKGTDEGPESN